MWYTQRASRCQGSFDVSCRTSLLNCPLLLFYYSLLDNDDDSFSHSKKHNTHSLGLVHSIGRRSVRSTNFLTKQTVHFSFLFASSDSPSFASDFSHFFPSRWRTIFSLLLLYALSLSSFCVWDLKPPKLSSLGRMHYESQKYFALSQSSSTFRLRLFRFTIFTHSREIFSSQFCFFFFLGTQTLFELNAWREFFFYWELNKMDLSLHLNVSLWRWNALCPLTVVFNGRIRTFGKCLACVGTRFSVN